MLPPRIGVQRATQLLLEHNASIAPLIYEDIGFELMFTESEVLIDALLELESRNIPSLPIHDAVIVPEDMQEEAAEVLAEAFRQHTGQPGEVPVEGRQ